MNSLGIHKIKRRGVLHLSVFNVFAKRLQPEQIKCDYLLVERAKSKEERENFVKFLESLGGM